MTKIRFQFKIVNFVKGKGTHWQLCNFFLELYVRAKKQKTKAVLPWSDRKGNITSLKDDHKKNKTQICKTVWAAEKMDVSV